MLWIMECPVMLLRECGVIIAVLANRIKGLVDRFVAYRCLAWHLTA